MLVATTNVNFFIHAVPCLDGYGVNDKIFKKYWKERQFYSCKDNYNYLSYVNEGSKKKIDFVDYSGNNEKSDGLFNSKGLCSKEQIAELKQGFRHTKSPIWHGLISFEEMFGKTYCNDYSQAYELMRTEFPKFLKRAGFQPDNIVWCAGFHTNTDHRHIHFSFYEKQPLRYRKNKSELCFSHEQVSVASMNSMKIKTELYLSQQKLKEKISNTRKQITEQFKNSTMKEIYKGDTYKMIKKIILLLPTNGRISYDSENMMFLKNDINHLVDQMIKQDKSVNAVYKTFLTLLMDKDEAITRMCEKLKIEPSKVVLYEKYHSDLYRRLGNLVIKKIVNISHEIKAFDIETKSRLAKKRLQRRKNEYMMNQSLKITEQVNREAMEYFEEHMRVLKEMEIKVLIEQGVIEL